MTHTVVGWHHLVPGKSGGDAECSVGDILVKVTYLVIKAVREGFQ